MLSRAIWLGLPVETRMKIATIFNMKKTTGTEVFGTRVVCDGYTEESFQVITIEKLQEVTGKKSTDFYELFNLLVNQINDEKIIDSVPSETSTEGATEEGAGVPSKPASVKRKTISRSKKTA